MRARPIAPFVLQPADVIMFEGWLRMSTLEQSLGQRARILLLLGEGVTPMAICEQLRITPLSVFKWRKRYQKSGIESLADLPCSGQPLKLNTEKIKEILTLTTHWIPKEATHWSVQLMAKYAGVTTWQVRQIPLGEQWPVWWSGGSPDYNRHRATNTPYAEWYRSLPEHQ